MNKQEVFDTIVNHLRKQGEHAIDVQEWQCRYLTADGKKCAVGCLISAEEYTPAMEAQTFHKFAGSNDLKVRAFYERMQEHEALMTSMQSVHDMEACSSWEKNFQRVAKEEGLIYTPPIG